MLLCRPVNKSKSAKLDKSHIKYKGLLNKHLWKKSWYPRREQKEKLSVCYFVALATYQIPAVWSKVIWNVVDCSMNISVKIPYVPIET